MIINLPPKMAEMVKVLRRAPAANDASTILEVRLDDAPRQGGADMATIREYRLARCANRGRIGSLDTGVIKNGERFPWLVCRELLRASKAQRAVPVANATPDAENPVQYLEAA